MNEQLCNQHVADFEALQSSIKRTVLELARDRYYFNNQPNDEDEGHLEFRFDDGSGITLSLASDGESVHAEAKPLEIPEAFWVSENNLCSWQRMELTALPPYSAIRQQSIIAVEALVEVRTDNKELASIMGWVFRCSAGDFICYYNNGDNSRILMNELPLPSDRTTMHLELIAGNLNAA